MIRIPERLTGEDVINSQPGKEGAEVLCALFHAGLFRDFVAEQDETLGSAFGDGITDVLDRLPLAGLSGDKHLGFGVVEGEDLLMKTSGTGDDGDVRDGERGIAFDAKGLDAELVLERSGKLRESGGRKGDEELAVRASGVWVSLPAECLVEAAQDVIVVRVGMDSVMKAVDDQMMLLDVVALGLVDGIRGEV